VGRYTVRQSICALPCSSRAAVIIMLATTSVNLGLIMQFQNLNRVWIRCLRHANELSDRELESRVMMT
jgi:hypothetical protein